VFNESFAVSVEQEGLRRWLAARGRSLELQDYLERQRADQLMVDAFADGRRRLAALYALSPPLPLDERRARKREILGCHRRAGAGGGTAAETAYRLRQMDRDGLNNAHLASVGTYFDCVPGFQRLLAANGGSLPAFYAAVRNMRTDAGARRALCRAPARCEHTVPGGAYGAGCARAGDFGASHNGARALRLARASPSCRRRRAGRRCRSAASGSCRPKTACRAATA
jgi:predicted aminopeptidase